MTGAASGDQGAGDGVVRSRVVVLQPGQLLPFDAPEWDDALVLVAGGALEVRQRRGRCWTFGEGSVLTLAGLGLDTLGGSGPVRTVLVVIRPVRPRGP